MSTTHKAIASTALKTVEHIQLPTLTPGPGQVLIRADSIALAPLDIYVVDQGFAVTEYPTTLGFALSGIIIETGLDSGDLRAADRVTVFTLGDAKARASQEYITIDYTLVAKIPHSVSFEDAATIPDNFVTAYYTLFGKANLGLDAPTSWPRITPPPNANIPILVYGGGATSAQYVIQLLRLAGYTRIFTTASKKHHDYLRSLGATDVFDYSSPDWEQQLSAAVGGDGKIAIAFDPIAGEGTLKSISKVLAPSGQIAFLLPVKQGNKINGAEEMLFALPKEKNPFPETASVHGVATLHFAQDENLKSTVMPKILPSLLENKALQPNRIHLLEKGTFLERVEAGLELLRHNRVSGEKIVIKIPSA